MGRPVPDGGPPLDIDDLADIGDGEELLEEVQAATAAAPVVDGPTALERFSEQVMSILVPAFGALVTALVGMFLTWARKRFKLQLSDQQIESWANVARRAALRGAEWARKKSKGMARGKKIPGPQVLEVAANWALDMGQTFGLPELGREKLEALIEAELFSLRHEGESDQV